MLAACKSVHFSRGFFFISCCIAQHHNAVHAFATSGLAMNHYSYSSSTAAAATDDRCSEEESTNTKDALFRILCLHGKGGNGEEFLERLHPLRRVVDERLMDSKHSNIA